MAKVPLKHARPSPTARQPTGSQGVARPPGTVQGSEGWLGPISSTWDSITKSVTEEWDDAVKSASETWDDFKEGGAEVAQKRVDELTEKAQRGDVDAFTWGDRAFLSALYNSFSVGGRIKGMPEAASLFERYLEASGSTLEIPWAVYASSTVVQKEMKRQKEAAVKKFQSSPKTTEFAQRSALLITESANKRLYYANNRYYLTSKSTRDPKGSFTTVWRVDDEYVFEKFKGDALTWRKLSFYTDFPAMGQTLRVYDGLSEFLVTLEMAKTFDHFSTSTEIWSPKK